MFYDKSLPIFALFIAMSTDRYCSNSSLNKSRVSESVNTFCAGSMYHVNTLTDPVVPLACVFFGMSHGNDVFIAVAAGFTLHLTILIPTTFKCGWKIITLGWNVP